MVLDDVTTDDIRSYVKCLPPRAFEPYEVRDGVPLFQVSVPVLCRDEKPEDCEKKNIQEQRLNNAEVFFNHFESRMFERNGKMHHDWLYVCETPRSVTVPETTTECIERVLRTGSIRSHARFPSKYHTDLICRRTLGESVLGRGDEYAEVIAPEVLVIAYNSLHSEVNDWVGELFRFPKGTRNALQAIFLIKEKVPK